MTTSTATLTANKQLVAFVFDQLFTHANADVIDAHFSPNYVQHSPAAGDGREGIRGFVAFSQATFPDSKATIHHLFAEGELVVVHSNIVAIPGTPGFAAVDIFRVVDGLIVEHWDASSEAPTHSANGNDPFSTVSAPVTDEPDAGASADESREVALALVTALGVSHDLDALDTLVADDFVQHDPLVGAGRSGLRAAVESSERYEVEVARVVAEGDYVAVHGHWHFADDRGVAIIDVFRVRDGRVAEQWSARQPVPEASANSNPMF